MSRKWVLDYPEASIKRKKYDDIISSLNVEAVKIRDATNPSIAKQTELVDSVGTLEGVYYEEYEKSVINWYNEEQRIAGEFILFESELSLRISSATTQSALWASRETMGHWEEEQVYEK
ncbi:hypothetical protein [Anaerosporobacter sp.]